MGKRRNRVCGADVHKDFIVATIQSADGTEFQEKFGATYSELERSIAAAKDISFDLYPIQIM